MDLLESLFRRYSFVVFILAGLSALFLTAIKIRSYVLFLREYRASRAHLSQKELLSDEVKLLLAAFGVIVGLLGTLFAVGWYLSR